jgi:hypothetical protein
VLPLVVVSARCDGSSVEEMGSTESECVSWEVAAELVALSSIVDRVTGALDER